MNNIDNIIIIATLSLGCLSSLIIALGHLNKIKEEPFDFIIMRIVCLAFSFMCGYSLWKVLHLIYKP